MTLPTSDSPLRIGLVGLGPTGAHHLERIHLRRDLRIVAACDGLIGGRTTHPLCQNVVPQMADLLAREDLDYILIAAPQNVRADLALRSLEAGKNVALEAPPCLDAAQVAAVLTAARRATRAVCVLPSRRDGFDIRAARQTVLAGTLGTIETARIVSWGNALPLRCAAPSRGDEEPEIAPGDGVFTFFAYQYVDQLLQLISRPPQTVYARISNPPASDPTATAFFLSIAFRGSGDGLIDVNLHAGASLQTGWMLAGSTGAYCQQRIYTAEPSGEIGDTPIAPAHVPQIDIYGGLFAAARSESCRLDSAHEAATVMHVIDAARKSSITGEAVHLAEMVGEDA